MSDHNGNGNTLYNPDPRNPQLLIEYLPDRKGVKLTWNNEMGTLEFGFAMLKMAEINLQDERGKAKLAEMQQGLAGVQPVHNLTTMLDAIKAKSRGS